MVAPSSAAQPLKVIPSSTPSKLINANSTSATTTPTATSARQKGASYSSVPTDISSPHELTAFVETLLGQLDAKFDEMSTQILDRMDQMSTRVDSLEASIQDIINGDLSGPSVPQSPTPGTPGGMYGAASGTRRNGSAP